MKLFIAGGCGEHGRNCFLVNHAHGSFLLDCGLMAGDENGTPRLTKAQIAALDCVFLTHSHQDHVGALPWLRAQGFAGPVVASAETLRQLPFDAGHTLDLEHLTLDFAGLGITWGRAGHCAGSVWYRFEDGGKSILFSGDYNEDSLTYPCDALRGQRADLAVVDCAYGRADFTFLSACEALIECVRAELITHPLLLLPVPKYGRGPDLLRLLARHFALPLYPDAHLQRELLRLPQTRDWTRALPPQVLAHCHSYTGTEKSGLLFVSDPQLKQAEHQALAEQLLRRGGFAVMTGSADPGSYSDTLIRQGRMAAALYPVHLNERQFRNLAAANHFGTVLPYHTPDFAVPDAWDI